MTRLARRCGLAVVYAVSATLGLAGLLLVAVLLAVVYGVAAVASVGIRAVTGRRGVDLITYRDWTPGPDGVVTTKLPQDGGQS